MRSFAFAGALLLLMLVLARCFPSGASPVVDGWPIGDPYVCSDPQCGPYLELATEGLAARNPGHPEIVEVTLHRHGVILGEDGQPLRYLSDRPSIAVFRLVDGSVRAIGVGHVGIAWGKPSVFDWGPALGRRALPGS